MIRRRAGPDDVTLTPRTLIAVLLWLGAWCAGVYLVGSRVYGDADDRPRVPAETGTWHLTVFLVPAGKGWEVAMGAVHQDAPPTPAPESPEGAAVQCTIRIDRDGYVRLGSRGGGTHRRHMFLTRTAHLRAEGLTELVDDALARAVAAGLRDEIAAAADAEIPGRSLRRAISAGGERVVTIQWEALIGVAILAIVVIGMVKIAEWGRRDAGDGEDRHG